MPPDSPSDFRASAGARVLVADDEPALVRGLRRQLERGGFAVLEANDAGLLRMQLAQEPEVVLLDLRLGSASGMELLHELRERRPDTEIIVMTGYASIDSAVACMRAGAFDYLEKPFADGRRVLQTVERALERRLLRTRNRELEGELDRRSALERVVAQSASMRRVLQTVRDLAANESNVLIEAESGTGKELVARAIHETSPRRDGPFVPVDCGALPEGMIEGELFGYLRGAFTGAVRDSEGLFGAADGGTLFLDEVGELPLGLQAKLLRAIQQREVRQLGATDARAIDVRLIAATNRDLATEVRGARFRADLFYRLRVVSLALPPLRERPEDVPVLASHFVERAARGTKVIGLEPEALERLIAHRWDGNVRELENTIEAAVALAQGPRITAADLRLSSFDEPRAHLPGDVALSLEAYERACLQEALRRCQGDVRSAAKLLGIGRSTFYRKLGSA
ncbi:MAG TPA: sigma-54 dependent transcriptional regulator [Myxococcota bacterium]|nr:sigma-54 dependent transcriptional regulator [Myxococcota bacterium]